MNLRRPPTPSLSESAPREDAALFFATLLAFSAVFHITDIGERHATPIAFAAFQRIVPLSILLLLLGRRRIRLPRTRLALLVAFSGLLSVGVFTYAVAEGITRAGAGNVAVVGNSMPLWIALISAVVFGERLPRRAIGGLLLGFGGLLVMFSSELNVSSGRIVVGMAIATAGAVAYSVATVLVKHAALRDERLDPLGVMTLQHAAALPVLLVFGFGTGGTAGTEWGAIGFWLPCVAAGLASVTGAAAYVTSLKRRSATLTSHVLFLVPVVAVGFEILLGHIPGRVTVLGMAIVVAGVQLVTSAGRSARRFRPLPRPARPAGARSAGARSAGAGPAARGALVHASVSPDQVFEAE